MCSLGILHRFGGFAEADLDKLKSFARKKWSTELEVREQSVKGWNWGEVKFRG